VTATQHGNPRIVDVVLSAVEVSKCRKSHNLFSWIVAIGFHAIVLLLAVQTRTSLETWSARMAALIHRDLSSEIPVEIDIPTSVLPHHNTDSPIQTAPSADQADIAQQSVPPPPTSKTVSSNLQTKPSHSEKEILSKSRIAGTTTHRRKPAPQPHQSVDHSSNKQSDDIADFTNQKIIPDTLTNKIPSLGNIAVDSNAIATESNTGTLGIGKPKPDNHQSTGKGRGGLSRGNLSQSVRLSQSAWKCAWPQAALSQDIYQQSVTIRVHVDHHGKVLRATTLSDPGFGFAPAAIRCAKRTRFIPARDTNGNRVPALSPPIRVRFVR